ncbi:MAG TPA: hypothetical protein VK448_01020 [Dissulfurispiraceae bacterium]|nr:hypothetical protein [Dissulfurispiraceae bacterium]
MYIFRGGQIVGKGIYWESERDERVIMKASGYLPGLDNKVYFKVPDCYLMIPVLFVGLLLSMALPYGIGLAIFACMCLLHNILFSVCSVCEFLMLEIISHMSATYKPNLSFFAGSHGKIKRSKKKITKAESSSSP